MREYNTMRKTAETDISLTLNIDGTGKSEIDTGCGFLDHMLTLFAKHARFDLTVKCVGDINVDYHHTTEDIGIVLGTALAECIGDCKGINRYGHIILPMDESLILCAVDLGGRAYLNYDLRIPAQKVGNFDTELIEEFFLAFVRNANITLHIKQLDGKNAHHIAEAAFKAFARALRQAVEIDEKTQNEIPSTKGVL